VLEVFAWENFREDKGLLEEWESVNCLFQVTEDEITQNGQGTLFKPSFDTDYLKSYIFLGLTLQKPAYSRSDLAKITREINRQSDIPIMVLFRYGNYVTLSIINRRPNKLDRDKDVLEKITLIKDININSPHRAHIEILADLALTSLPDIQNFDQLHTAWQKVLNTSELNNKFFQEVSNWYFWATQTVTFPDGGEADESLRNATSVIRLITRLIFVWFLKEKGLVPDALFDENQLENFLNPLEAEESTYYKAILQNLFFATLNTEMNTDEKPDNRKFRGKFRGKNQQKGGRDGHYGITNVYRYQDYFTNADEFLGLCSDIPFLNGGLFECLDRDKDDDSAPSPTGKEKTKIRIDGFSDREDNVLNVPNVLFFGEATDVDLNKAYGTKNKKYKVQGLINIFNRYKFTIDENTPIEEEIALDPELLGKVFENLLAEYNPETETTARKKTGSFYTPREIVNYMVDESLIAYLQNALLSQGSSYVEVGSNQTNLFGNEYKTGQLSLQTKLENSRFQGREQELESQLRGLLSYSEDSHQFNDDEVDCLINAIDNLKIIDIACGSGAFPMGILQKLVFILGKLDPHNIKWKQQQKEKTIAPILKDIQVVKQISYEQAREEAIQKLQERLAEIEYEFENNEMDYPRKLFLIENCIFGVDIQPIAVQISKLRFFISLIVDQRVNNNQPNRGILPLPNLETKFVAANSLIGLETQLTLRSPEVIKKEEELKQVRQQHFKARTPKTKKKCREKDNILRQEISQLLKATGLETATADTLARWNPYDLNTCADFFDPSWMFGVDAFDISIGNPPYVRADSGEEHLKLRQRIIDSKRYETLWEKWDLYIPFIELGHQLLNPNGITTMIVSDAYCHAKYAQKSQKYFLKNSKIIKLDFLSKIKVFEAGVYNIVYFYQKADGRKNKPERRVHDPEFGVIELLPTDEQKDLDSRVFFPEDGEGSLYSNATVKISSIYYVTVGMVVNAHEKKAEESFKMDDLLSEIQDKLHPKPFVEGKHLDIWLPVTNKWLEWGTYRAPTLFRRPTFPEIYEVEEKILVQRSPGSDPKTCYDNQKLYYTESSVGFIPWHSLAGVRNNSIKKTARYGDEKPPRPDLPKREELEKISRRFAIKYVLGIMNSAVARDFLRANRRSNIHLYPDDWKQLPIPDVTLEQQQPIVKLVDKILEIKRQNSKANTRELERKIDEIVYKLYGLEKEEIQIIEESGKR
jgi:type I restriction-modification system DNA methylase subunit